MEGDQSGCHASGVLQDRKGRLQACSDGILQAPALVPQRERLSSQRCSPDQRYRPRNQRLSGRASSPASPATTSAQSAGLISA